MKNKIILALGTSSFFVPLAALAQTTNYPTPALNTAVNFAQAATIITAYLVPAAFSLGLVYFFYGMAKYILHAGDEEAKETGKRIMIYGVIAMFVMISIFGIVRAIGNALGTNDNQYLSPGTITPPNVTLPR